MVEKCCHFFDLMNLITGAIPIKVMASGAQDVNHLEESYDGKVISFRISSLIHSNCGVKFMHWTPLPK